MQQEHETPQSQFIHQPPIDPHTPQDPPKIGENEEMPQIVWLRGDEPYYSHFNLDAEQAMALLGIKRSRLTQISGKELRVGRTKMGRYIKPLYREEDVKAYLEWTKPTSTSKKSSESIKEAALELELKADRITASINDPLVFIRKNIAKIESMLQTHDMISMQKQIQELSHLSNLSFRHTKTQNTNLEQIKEQLAALTKKQEIFHDIVGHQQQSLIKAEQTLSQLSSVTEEVKKHQETLNTLIELSSKQQTMLEALLAQPQIKVHSKLRLKPIKKPKTPAFKKFRKVKRK